MMDPSIGWYQEENKGPAYNLWVKLWMDFNFKDGKEKPSNEYDHYLKLISKLRQLFPQFENPASTYDLEKSPQLIAKYGGTPWRKAKHTYYEGIHGLNKEMEDFYEYMRPKPIEYEIRVEVQSRITQTIRCLWRDAEIECYGSFKTNTYLPTSDIDLVVVNDRWSYLPLAELEQHLINHGQCLSTQITVRDRAAVPIINMVDFMTGIKINISFNRPEVVRSVILVNEYLKVFPNAAKLLLVVKQFILQRDFNEVFKGGLNSYSLVLMVVHFLKTNPDLQVGPKESNLGHLLMRFLDLYGRTLNYDMVGLNVKDGIFAKKSQLLAHMRNGHDSRYAPSLLCIEDPLDPTNNVSKSSYNVPKIRDAFGYAFEILDKAVGPNQQVVGRTETILGRVIRVTDAVVDRRAALIRAHQDIMWTHRPPNPYRTARGNNRSRGNRGWNNRNRWQQNRRNNRWPPHQPNYF